MSSAVGRRCSATWRSGWSGRDRVATLPSGRVTAIGPEDLDQRFADSRTGQLFRALASQYGMQVAVDRKGELTLAAAPDPQLHYARPVPSQSPSTPPSGSSGSPVPSSPGGH